MRKIIKGGTRAREKNTEAARRATSQRGEKKKKQGVFTIHTRSMHPGSGEDEPCPRLTKASTRRPEDRTKTKK